ncbi:hypothetical protein B0T25DRAFT_452243 [Lasiosphaeria hispida]|uniref:Uncharacterized protein n=1 Tax=Lasiosphaeria hispida TaxID=260671 RepID=A0AAJ0HL37_9PEZI|nr:hypothetical protein B0T25DRAFT_452243 [Lasiosphaeria hispida]
MAFHPNCTLPSNEPGIVASSNMRGTLDIVWSCLAVVLLCTWVVLHENVPAEGSTNAPFWDRLFLAAYLTVQKACSFVYALFAPELFTGKAMMCLYFARHVRDLMEGQAGLDNVDWGIYHAFLANMGGFAIEFTEDTATSSEGGFKSGASRAVRDKEDGPLFCTKYDGNKWFIFNVPAVVKGRWREDTQNMELISSAIDNARTVNLGYHTPLSYYENLLTLRGNIWVVDGVQLHYARKQGVITSLPRITEQEIMDKSKGDWVTKSLAILQVSWLWVQLAARTVNHLTATQLEIMTAAFATCSVITYALYFQKPKDVKTRVRITAARYPTVNEMAEMGRRGPTAVWFRRVFLCLGNDNYHHEEGKDTAPALILVCGFIGLVFGSVHFACWDSHFPTDGEKLGWRIACGLLLGIPIPICSLMLLDRTLDMRRKRQEKGKGEVRPGRILRVIAFMLEGVYVLARGYMMLEAGRSLWYQPWQSFGATWAANTPHVGG